MRQEHLDFYHLPDNRVAFGRTACMIADFAIRACIGFESDCKLIVEIDGQGSSAKRISNQSCFLLTSEVIISV